MINRRFSKILSSLVLILTFFTTNLVGDLPGLEWAKIKEVFAVPSAGSSSGAMDSMKDSAQTSQSFQTDLFTGRAQFSVPIFTPPGRRGMAPQVGLTYSSSGGNGWLGVGWGLDHGFIQRSTKKGVPSYNDNQDTFTFVLNGVNSDLVKISTTEYHAKDESGEFLKFTFENNHWTVLDKSGATYKFGETDQAKSVNARGIFCWCLEKMRDVHGNTIRYTYFMDQGEIYISRIDYNGNEDESFDETHSVEFILEDRPDVTFSYMTGARVETRKRLHEIQVKVLNQLSRKYTFTYEQSPNVNRSRLQSIQECGTDGATCLPTQIFTYTNHQLEVESQHEIVNLDFIYGVQGIFDSLAYNNPSNWMTYSEFMDMNGDGIPDRLTLPEVSPFNQLAIQWNNGSSFTPFTQWQIFNRDQGPNEGIRWTNPGVGATVMDTIDINGDSLPDRVWYFTDQPQSIVNWRIEMNTGNGFSSPVFWQVENGWPGYWYWGVPHQQTGGDGMTYQDLIDMNGDGLLDRVMAQNGEDPWDLYIYRIQINNGNGFNPSQIWHFPNPGYFHERKSVRWSYPAGQTKIEMVDLNGDGLPDRVYANNMSSPYNQWEVSFNNGSGFEPLVLWNIENGSVSESTWGLIREGSTYVRQDLIDVNGDGLPDRVMSKTSAPYDFLRVQFNTGSGFAPSVNWNISNPESDHGQKGGSVRYLQQDTYLRADTRDFNGDGLPDRIYAVDDGQYNKWKVAKQLGTVPDLLSTVNNGRGGVTTIEYKPSTQFDNRELNEDGTPGIHRLPFPVNVVSKVTQNDGMGNSVVTNYSYKGGMYDAPTREFRGFRETTVTDAVGTQSIHTFLQDEHAKGRPLSIEVKDSLGNTFSKEMNTWECNDTLFPGVHFVHLAETNSYLYDGNSTFKQIRKRFDYDTFGNLVIAYDDGDPNTTTDDKRSETSYALNPDLHILNTVSNSKIFNAQNQTVSEKVFYYDGAQNHTVPPVKGSLTKQEDLNTGQSPGQGIKTEMTYDDFGNLLTVKDARGFTTTNEYDTTLKIYLVRITNTFGHTQEFTYDPLIAQITEARDANNQISRTIYDALGRSVKVVASYDSDAAPTKAVFYDDQTIPNGSGAIANRIVTYQKKSSDAPALTVDGNPHSGYITVYSFMDGFGRELSKRSLAEDGTHQIVSGAVTFDERGMMKKQYIPYLADFRTTYASPPAETAYAEITYDAIGRRTRIDMPDGTHSTVQYDDYQKTTTDPNGHSKRYTQDSSGNLMRVEEFNLGATYTTLYQYDTLNRLTQTTNHYGHVTTVAYDQLGRKTSMSDPNMGHWTYEYDANGNLLKQTDAKNQVIFFTYDALNRLVKKTYPDATLISYVYDDCPPATCGGLEGENYPIGRLLKVDDFSGTQLFRYDQLGRVIQDKKFPDDGNQYSFARIYDPAGRVTSLEYPDGEILTLTFNAMEQVDAITLINSDETQSSIISNADYNTAGQITKIVYGNGVTTDYTYNPQNFRLENVLTRNQAQITLQNLSYAFDNVGNILSLADAVNSNSQTFLYDDLDRLTSATGSYGTHSYYYDAIGNILQKAGATFQYLDPAHTQAVTKFTQGTEVWNYTYDANGNMTKRWKPKSLSSNETLIYDYDNRLIRIQKSSVVSAPCTDARPCQNLPESAVVMESVYDASGQRVKKKTNDKVTYYLGKDYEVESGGNLSLTRKAFFLGDTRIAEKEVSGAGIAHTRFFHQDHLGSTNVITNEQGAQTLLMEYLPYGEAKVRLGSDPVNNTFTGQKEDLESSLMYYNARYYDPKLGRFITADWIVPDATNPQEFNRYSYVNNNPIKYTDPTGHKKKKKSFWKSFLKWTGIIVGAALGIAFGIGIFSVMGAVMKTALGATLGSIAGGAIAGAGGAVFANGVANVFQGQNPFNGVGQAAISGAILGGVDAGFGKLVPNSNFGSDVIRVGVDGAVGGGVSEINGGSFWQGAAVASAISGARLAYRVITQTTAGTAADPSLRTSDGSAKVKGDQIINGFGSMASDVGEKISSLKDITIVKKWITGETAPPMRALSMIVPGLDPMAEMHDYAMHAVSGRVNGRLAFELINKGTIAPAYGITVAGAFHDPIAMSTVMPHREDRR